MLCKTSCFFKFHISWMMLTRSIPHSSLEMSSSSALTTMERHHSERGPNEVVVAFEVALAFLVCKSINFSRRSSYADKIPNPRELSFHSHPCWDDASL